MTTQQGQAPAVLYGAAAIAKYLGIAEKPIRHLIARRTIPTFRIGRVVCARPERIDAALAELERQEAGDVVKSPTSRGNPITTRDRC